MDFIVWFYGIFFYINGDCFGSIGFFKVKFIFVVGFFKIFLFVVGNNVLYLVINVFLYCFVIKISYGDSVVCFYFYFFFVVFIFLGDGEMGLIIGKIFVLGVVVFIGGLEGFLGCNSSSYRMR